MAPPRAGNTALTSSFPLSDANNEVTCPLINQDNTPCRKRCLGEKRYRSMQEHIRRAHPEYYLPKLPATKESFELMINSPPRPRPEQDPNHVNHVNNHHLPQHSDPSGLSPSFNLDTGLNSTFEGYHGLGQHDGGYYTAGETEAAHIYNSMQSQQRGDYRRGSLIPVHSAAAALAELQYHRADQDWGGHDLQVIYPFLQPDMSPTSTEEDKIQTFYSDPNVQVDPSLEDHNFMQDQSVYPDSAGLDHSGLLPNSLAHSPPDRSGMLPSLPRSLSRSGHMNRPRKSSLSQQARMPKHERKRSKELAKRISGERTSFGKRWEDLIEAAASATEDNESRDLTPVSSPTIGKPSPPGGYSFAAQIPASPYQSPHVPGRTFALGSQFNSAFQASPLTRALTPPPADHSGLELQPFPSVDSSLSSNLSHQHHHSAGSGSNFQIMDPNSIDSNSSSIFNSAGPGTGNVTSRSQPQIYCAACHRTSILVESYACTHCISGLCGPCIEAIIQEQSRGRSTTCPKCRVNDCSFKPFNLELKMD